MREGWEYKPIGEIAEVTDFVANGSFATLRENVQYHDEPSYAVLVRVVDFSSDFDKSKFVYVDKHAYNFLSKSVLKGGEIIMSNVGSLGKEFICPDLGMPMTLGPNAIVIRSDNNKFYYYCFFSDWFQDLLKTISGRGMLAKFNKTQFKQLVVPVPPKEIQDKIVNEFNHINELIAIKDKQLRELEELEQTIFHEMFGDPILNEKEWNAEPLKKNVKEMFLGPFGSSLKVDSYVPQEESFCMVYEQKHAIKGTIDSDNHYISKAKYDSLERFNVKAGDFIMSCRGTIGKVYRLPEGAPLGIIHPSLMKIRIKEDAYNPVFFQFMLVKIVANERTNGNCVQMAITAKALGEKKLIIPPMEVQEKFADRIKTIREQYRFAENSKQELQDLLASRMQYWFD